MLLFTGTITGQQMTELATQIQGKVWGRFRITLDWQLLPIDADQPGVTSPNNPWGKVEVWGEENYCPGYLVHGVLHQFYQAVDMNYWALRFQLTNPQAGD